MQPFVIFVNAFLTQDTSGLPSELPLDPLLSSLYETTEDFAAWTPFLGSLCEATQTDNAALVIHDLVTDDTSIVFCHFAPEQARRYRETYAALNPWTRAAREAGPNIDPPGTVQYTGRALPLEELRKTTFYQEWGRQNNVVHGIALNLGIQDGRFTYLSLANGEEAGPVKPQAAQLLAALYPHVARAVRLQASRIRVESLLDVLDRTSGAVFVLTKKGFLVEATRSAQVLLQEARVVRKDVRGHLRACERRSQAELESALSKAPTTRYHTIRLGKDTWGVLTGVQHASPEPQFRRDQFMLTVPRAGTSARSVESFAVQFSLSAAETRLVRALLEHGSLTPAAASLGISRETGKTQLARVFARTGTNRQTELIRLFSSLGVIMQGGE